MGWVAITEADIDNYAGMYLRKEEEFLEPYCARRSVAACGCRGQIDARLRRRNGDALRQPVARAHDRAMSPAG